MVFSKRVFFRHRVSNTECDPSLVFFCDWWEGVAAGTFKVGSWTVKSS